MDTCSKGSSLLGIAINSWRTQMATRLGVKDELGLSIGPSLEGIITFKSMAREARHQGDGRWFLDPMSTVMLCCFKMLQGISRWGQGFSTFCPYGLYIGPTYFKYFGCIGSTAIVAKSIGGSFDCQHSYKAMVKKMCSFGKILSVLGTSPSFDCIWLSTLFIVIF